MSATPPDIFIQTQADLLGASAPKTKAAIAQVLKMQAENAPYSLHKELIIISQLHEDENLRNAALAALKNEYTPAELIAQSQCFEIFRTIERLFPWENAEHIHTQLGNYSFFVQNAADYRALLCRFAPYRELYLRLAQQLYLLYEAAGEAAQILEEIISYCTTDAEAFYALARIRQTQGQLVAATALYEHCLQLEPAHFYALSALAALLAKNPEQYEYALALYHRAIAVEPYSSELYAEMAQVCYTAKEEARAHQMIEIALSINPHQPTALNLLARYYLEVKQDLNLAIETYQKGLDHPLHGDNPLLLAGMAALSAESLQEYQKARIYYEKSLKADPRQAETTIKYARLLLDFFHDQHAAAAALSTYLAHCPQDETAQELLANIQQPPPSFSNIDPVENENKTIEDEDEDEDEDDDDDWAAGDSGSDG
jgi:tetratricopeptide (TPR) repeat protein